LAARPTTETGRKKRDRGRTEAELLEAAERLFARGGVLEGLNLNEVATEAGVNRGQIYQLYGDRRTLLRAMLNRTLLRFRERRPTHWDAGFADRRRAMIRFLLDEIPTVRAQALLALDGDEELRVFPEFDRTRAALERDRATGALPPDADGAALHVLTSAAVFGYVLLREVAARDTAIPLPELDQRVIAAYDQLIERMVR